MNNFDQWLVFMQINIWNIIYLNCGERWVFVKEMTGKDLIKYSTAEYPAISFLSFE